MQYSKCKYLLNSYFNLIIYFKILTFLKFKKEQNNHIILKIV